MTNDKFYLRAFGAALTQDEREFLKSIACEIEDRFLGSTMVNIGVFHGCSMHCLRAGAENGLILGIDIDLSQGIENERLLRPHSLIESDSAAWGRSLKGKISLLFIDGDHHYEQVKADIEAWVSHVSVNGIMIFHDYSPKQVDLDRDPSLDGVRRAVDEWYTDIGNWTEFARVDSIIGFRRNE